MPNEDMLLAASADYLAHDTDEGRDSRAIGALMTRRGTPALMKLCAVFFRRLDGRAEALAASARRNVPRARCAAGAFRARRASHTRRDESGSKFLRMAAMECRLVFDARLSPDMRRKLADAFLNSTSDFSFPFDLEKAESAVVRMG